MFALLICICLKKAVSLSTLCQKNKNVSFFRTHLYVYSESRGDLDTNTIQCSNYMARRGHRTSRELSVRLCVLDSASCCQGARRRSIKSSTHLIEFNHGFSRIFFIRHSTNVCLREAQKLRCTLANFCALKEIDDFNFFHYYRSKRTSLTIKLKLQKEWERKVLYCEYRHLSE